VKTIPFTFKSSIDHIGEPWTSGLTLIGGACASGKTWIARLIVRQWLAAGKRVGVIGMSAEYRPFANEPNFVALGNGLCDRAGARMSLGEFVLLENHWQQAGCTALLLDDVCAPSQAPLVEALIAEAKKEMAVAVSLHALPTAADVFERLADLQISVEHQDVARIVLTDIHNGRATIWHPDDRNE
jgi:hypothetical protein